MSAVSGAFTYWKAHIPDDTQEKMLVAASTAFVLQSLLVHPVSGLVAAGLSALATLIHGLITPFFAYLAKNRALSWPEEILRGSLALMITAALCHGIDKIQLIYDNILFYSLRVIASVLIQPDETIDCWKPFTWILATRKTSSTNSFCILP